MKLETNPNPESETNSKIAKTLFESLSRLRKRALVTEEEFEAYYVPASEARNAEETDRTLKTLLSIQTADEPCHILFSGHLGCGKSTELRRLGRELEADGFLVGIGVCEENLDMNTVKYTDLILFILETLLKCAEEKKIPINEKSLEHIEDYWKSVHTTVQEDKNVVGIGIGGAIEARTPGLLAQVFSAVVSVRSLLSTQSEARDEYRRVIEPSFSTFIGLVNEVISDIRQAGMRAGFKDAPPVVLLDDLEKANRDATAELFDKHSQDLTKLHLHLVIPFPIEMCYTPSYNQIRNHYNSGSGEWILPMIKLRDWDEKTRTYKPFEKGPEILRSIISRRMDKGLFVGNTLDTMIEKTGGFLRHLFTAVFEAALNAASRQSPHIEEKDVTVALQKVQDSVSRMFPDSGRARLERIKNGDKHYAADEELMVFLRSGAVFEYNGKRWVDLHPLVLDWLEETQGEKN